MLSKLKKWLKRPDNSTVKLAYLLGYSSGSTVSNWISRQRVPRHVQKRLKEILK